MLISCSLICLAQFCILMLVYFSFYRLLHPTVIVAQYVYMYILSFTDVRCLNDRDEVLPEEICISQIGSMPDVTQKCYVASCEQDTCKFSDWAEWTGCSKRCGGHRSRIRHMEGAYLTIM
jgi:hypothetical protein